ncbi:MAG: hypothetical protein PUC47_07705 [Oscillospiraceae bacterium]|nr:hypothetical protein [Oscillospiraceae bacterium]
MVTDNKLHAELSTVSLMAQQNPRELIRLSEERYRSQVRQAADWFCSRRDHNRVILLAGPSSSGKTTTSLNLQAELGRRGVRTLSVSLDDFFIDRDRVPVGPDGKQDLESPDTVDARELERCLEELAGQGRCAFPIYDFTKGRRSTEVRELEFDDHTAVIIEGLHALNPSLCTGPLLNRSMKVYISIKTEYYEGGRRILSTRELRLIRRIIRDNNYRACPPEQTLSMWGSVVAGEEKYIRPYRTGADLWIDSLHLYEPMLYRPLAEELLRPLENGPHGETVRRLLEGLGRMPSLPPVKLPRQPENDMPPPSAVWLPEDTLLREFLVLS